MKVKGKIIFLLIILLAVCIKIDVNATGGALRKSSIKTCPNGVTYGEHSDGKGGTHWHVAVTNGNNYYSSGEAISYDPCPNSSKNYGTAGETNGHSNSSNNKNTPIIVKSNDASIKVLKINDNAIEEISKEMNYEVNTKEVEITIITGNEKATYRIYGNKKGLLTNKINVFKIEVTAEDGTIEEYVLNISRKPSKSNVIIKRFELDYEEIEFNEKNIGRISVSKGKHDFSHSYELSDITAKLTIYDKNDKIIEQFDNVKIGDKYKLVIEDNEGNINNYYIEIEEETIFEKIIEVIIGLYALIALIITLWLIFKYKKRNKK